MSEKQIFGGRAPEAIFAENSAGQHTLNRALGPFSLMALGIGAVIGAGLFSLTGIAAGEYAGPAVIISFMIAGLGARLLVCATPNSLRPCQSPAAPTAMHTRLWARWRRS